MLIDGVPGGISMRARLANLSILILLAALGAAAGQSASGEDPAADAAAAPTFAGEVSVGYVLVPVVVRGPGGFVLGLDADRFAVTVDGSPVAVDSFERGDDAPIGVLFLQDLSGSMGVGPKLSQSRTLVECVLKRSRPGDEFAVASFSDQQLFVEVPFPGSTEAIREVVAGWKGYGRTALHDAVAWLPTLVHSRSSPRRAVVLITDGVDNASLVGPTEARTEIKHAEVPVHVVGLETGSIFTLRDDGDKLHPLADTLNLIGWATGGGYHPVDSRSDIARACTAIIADLRHQYVLGFPTRGDAPVARHTIEVALAGRGKKLDVRFRRSYDGTVPLTMGGTR
jgi:Ca-activated chloride channel homolog